MPLLPSPNASSWPNTLGIDFHMMTRDGTLVRCNVTCGALDKFVGDRRDRSQLGQLAAFVGCREKIERLASQKYDRGLLEDGVIIVRPEDVVKGRRKGSLIQGLRSIAGRRSV
jgi:hypothetical protein